MQQRLPDVGAAAIDQRDSRLLPAAEAVSQFSRQFEPGGAATDNDDVAEGGIYHADSGVGLQKDIGSDSIRIA
jgi:hypothetical protein